MSPAGSREDKPGRDFFSSSLYSLSTTKAELYKWEDDRVRRISNSLPMMRVRNVPTIFNRTSRPEVPRSTGIKSMIFRTRFLNVYESVPRVLVGSSRLSNGKSLLFPGHNYSIPDSTLVCYGCCKRPQEKYVSIYRLPLLCQVGKSRFCFTIPLPDKIGMLYILPAVLEFFESAAATFRETSVTNLSFIHKYFTPCSKTASIACGVEVRVMP